MSFPTHDPLSGTGRRGSVGLRLLPLVLAAVWACTALSVEVSSPRLDDRVWRVGLGDLLVNIVLYVPLGAALRRRGVVFAVMVGAVLSTGVEIVQLFYPDRYTAATDVAANIAGVLIGWVLSNRSARRSVWRIDPIFLTKRLSIFAAVLFVSAVWYLSLPGPRSDFANWDPDCRLIVADELTRDRSWDGAIEALAVFDGSLSRREIERCARLDASSALDAHVASLAPLYFVRPAESLDSIRGVPLVGGAEQERLHERLVSKNRLTVLVWFRTRDENQSGPARIAGYSKSPYAQNFSLGQENREIIFRLRTRTTVPGGFYPQTKTRPLLEKNRRTFVAATYDGRNIRVFVDGRYEARLNLCAHGRRSPFLSDSGLPASAAFVGGLFGLVWVGALGWLRPRYGLGGALGGLAGGLIFLAAGGAGALPEFAPWVPVVSVWAGAVTGYSVAAAGEDYEASG